MKKILFISVNQYGYNTDLYKYSDYLSDDYDVFYLSIFSSMPKTENSKVSITYINRPKSGMLGRLKLVFKSISFIRQIKPDYVFVKYFASCSLIKMLSNIKGLIVDIRTATIDVNPRIRRIKDKVLSLEVNQFKHISVISSGLIETLKLDREKCFVLPLGADKLISKQKDVKKCMNLLYVGIFDQRNIEDTINGFALFYYKYKNIIPCQYTIIGYSYRKEYEESVIKTIEASNLQNIVRYVGRKNHNELKQYFECHNIGVSYIPLRDYFQHQPPTKTYEYIQNGLICLATETFENSKVINSANGVLISDGPEAFRRGLEEIYANIDKYDSKDIMKHSEQYNWRKIVNDVLKKKLESII